MTLVIEKKKSLPDTRPESKIYGRAAVASISRNRPNDVVRVYITNEAMKEFGNLLRSCSKRKKAYHVVSEAELGRISKSVHHEGVMVIAKDEHAISDRQILRKIATTHLTAPILFLDSIGNPHNIGAIIRTAAHFGVQFVLHNSDLKVSPSLARVAEGGLEHTSLFRLTESQSTLLALKDMGFTLLGTSSHRDESLFGSEIPVKSVIAMGSEQRGLSKRIEDLCDRTVKVPGSGHVESLNVSVACGLVLGEFARNGI